MARPHEPVLVSDVVRLLEGKAVVVDATVGAGGHAEALLAAGAELVIGVDRDPSALAEAEERLRRFGHRFVPVGANFGRIGEVVRGAGWGSVGGVLYDLGVSSMQLERGERGFSYRIAGPLDMRMGGGDAPRSAAEIVNTYPEERLAEIIAHYGEERFARRIARAIVRARSRAPLTSTEELAAVVAAAVPRRRGGPHPARRTFQGLRIEVNAELEELTASLPQAVSLLEPGGRVVVISYHSLEDRIVKRFLGGTPGLTVLTSKPIVPSRAEALLNPRARSAKLRAAELQEAS